MIIIRKTLSLFLVLVVITSLSFTAFAAGEQPSGNNYSYITSTGGLGTNNYWYSVSQSIYQIGMWLKPLKDSTYKYFDGTGTYSTNNFFTALANSLYNIGANVKSNFTSVLSDTGTIASRISTTNTTLSTISSTQLPTQSGFSYDNNTGSVSNQTYWSATSNQLSFIFRRLATINTNIEDIESKVQDYSTLLSNIYTNSTYIRTHTSNTATNTSSIATSSASIDTSTQSMNTNLAAIYNSSNVVTHPYMAANERISAGNSNYNFWWAVSTSLSYIGSDLDLARKSLDAMVPDLDDLHTMFASPEDLALKADQENNISAATSNFLSGTDSSTSVGSGGIGQVKDLGDGVSDFFDPGVSSGNLFTLLSDNSSDGPWMWFTQAVADDLDGVAASNRNQRSSYPEPYVVDFYGAKMDELDKLLGGLNND